MDFPDQALNLVHVSFELAIQFFIKVSLVQIAMLMRLCDVHEIPLATNYKSAHMMIKYFNTK